MMLIKTGVRALLCSVVLGGVISDTALAGSRRSSAAQERELARKDPESARVQAERRIAAVQDRLREAVPAMSDAGHERLAAWAETEIEKAQRALEAGDGRGALTFTRRAEALAAGLPRPAETEVLQ